MEKFGPMDQSFLKKHDFLLYDAQDRLKDLRIMFFGTHDQNKSCRAQCERYFSNLESALFELYTNFLVVFSISKA